MTRQEMEGLLKETVQQFYYGVMYTLDLDQQHYARNEQAIELIGHFVNFGNLVVNKENEVLANLNDKALEQLLMGCKELSGLYGLEVYGKLKDFELVQKQNTPIQGSRPDHKLSMTEAGLPDVGPCMLRTLLAIAEDRAGKNLTTYEISIIVTAQKENGNIRDDWAILKSNVDIIDAALKKLNSKERAVYIKSVTNVQDLPNETQVTAIHTKKNMHGYQHWVKGDSNGKIQWDPLGYFSFTNSDIDRIDSYRFL